MNERPLVFMCESIFNMMETSSPLSQYRIQIEMFKINGSKKEIICNKDTLIDPQTNLKVINDWARIELDLTNSYRNNLIPDSCTIHFTCDVNPADEFAVNDLFIDNVRFRTYGLKNNKPLVSERPPIQLFPNPAKTSCTVKFYSASIQPYELLLYDIKGSLVWKQAGNTNINENNLIIPLTNYAKGIYSIVLKSGTEEKPLKLVIE
jgi:hypothetical protein